MKAIGFFIWATLVALGLWWGEWCVNYSLLHTVHKTIPVLWALLITLITGDFSVIVALVVKILILVGILQ